MKLFKNFFITIKTKGFIATFIAVKSFFIILLINVFSSSAFIKRKIFNYKMYLDPRDKGISRTLILFGERELDHKIILEKVLKKNMKIFDIGANIGYYVLMESKLVGKKGKILAIEPVQKNMRLLQKNLKLNNNKITETIHSAADSKKNVKANKSISHFFTTTHSNIGRLTSQEIVNVKSLTKFSKKLENGRHFLTPTQHIEELIRRNFVPDFIRMDIEGSEADILNDLASLKLKKKPIVCFETHSSQYKSYPKKKVSMKKSKKVGNVINVRKVETRNLSTMEKALKKMFKIGYKVKFASTSYEKGSIQLKKLGYKSLHNNIKTDDVMREIYKDLKEKDAIDLICHTGGLRTILIA